ncbi:hypothetical protein [Rhodococcus sp. HNM0569]|uniref:hypothetical protein n=1 Tax=Rhodococcus sp. HNM0569 TaxID=2716340 RepID=UPI0016AF0B9D|nr:hypothetical protein [Rhodococcus sp. HNM0569]NLU82095.1 hypothetical protein [Rhodococcus sp. HNM0569]
MTELNSVPTVTGRPEQFIGPAGSTPPGLETAPQYADLEMQSRTVVCTNFEAFDHSALVTNVEPIQTASVDAFRQEWANGTNTVTDTFATFASSIGRAISEKWQGASGEAASTAILGYAKNSARMADATNLIARQVGLLGDSLGQTKSNLPGEPAATFPGKIAGFFGADGWDDERRENAKRQAVQLLNNVYYGNGISPTAEALPKFPDVRSPINSAPGATGGQPSGGTSTPGGGGEPPTGRDGEQQAGAPTGGGEGDVGTSPTDPGSAQAGTESGSRDGLGSPDSSAQTVAASAQPSGIPGMGAGGLGAGGGGGSAGGLSAGGVGGGAGAGGLTAVPPGGGVVAGPGGAGGMRPAAAAAAGRAGMGGMGMAPMGGARGGGRGEGDNEHKTPDYLQNDELRQWIDEQADRGYAPVIGAPRPAPGDGNGGSGQQ